MNWVKVGMGVQVGAIVTVTGTIVTSCGLGGVNVNGVIVAGGEINVEAERVADCAAPNVCMMSVPIGTLTMDVGVASNDVSEKMTPRQQAMMMQVKIRLMPKIRQFFVSNLFREDEANILGVLRTEEDVEGVNESPVPGAEMVGRTPRLPMLTVNPLLPMDDEIPDLLRFSRNPFPNEMVLRKRKGIFFTYCVRTEEYMNASGKTGLAMMIK